MKENSIAIILVNYNGIKDTIDCIESIKKIKYKNYKIIVVDNASKKKEGLIIADKYKDIKVINSKQNLGFSGGNNLGIDYAIKNNYEYIMLLNNDTIIDEQIINKLLQYANNETIVVPKMYYYDDKKRIWYGGGKINKFTGKAEHFNINCIDQSRDNITKCTFATGCCMLIHRDIVNKIGKLEEEYFMYCEDTDYCLKALTNGLEIVYVPDAKLWHKVSKSTGGDSSAFSVYYMTRNRLIYIKKYKHYFSKIAYCFTLLTRYMRIIQYAILRKPEWKSILKGITDYKNGITGHVDKYM